MGNPARNRCRMKKGIMKSYGWIILVLVYSPVWSQGIILGPSEAIEAGAIHPGGEMSGGIHDLSDASEPNVRIMPDASSIVFNIGSHTLLPNQADQSILFSLSGNGIFAGLNFSAVVEDGFPEISGSTINGPNLTAVDLIGIGVGNVFSANHTGQTDLGSGAQALFYSVTTQSGAVSASGQLGKLTVDTTGILAGYFALSVGGNVALSIPATQFIDSVGTVLTASIGDGTITVVPEPKQVVILCGFLSMIVVFVGRHRIGLYLKTPVA